MALRVSSSRSPRSILADFICWLIIHLPSDTHVHMDEVAHCLRKHDIRKVYLMPLLKEFSFHFTLAKPIQEGAGILPVEWKRHAAHVSIIDFTQLSLTFSIYRNFELLCFSFRPNIVLSLASDYVAFASHTNGRRRTQNLYLKHKIEFYFFSLSLSLS